jgi:hypothetical protein
MLLRGGKLPPTVNPRCQLSARFRRRFAMTANTPAQIRAISAMRPPVAEAVSLTSEWAAP